MTTVDHYSPRYIPECNSREVCRDVQGISQSSSSVQKFGQYVVQDLSRHFDNLNGEVE